MMDFFAAIVLLCGATAADPAPYSCMYTTGPIKIDGHDDDDAWKKAKPVNEFSMPWVREGSKKATTATRAKLMWDDEYLYFFAQMDDLDLFADVKKHDGQTWDNDVFELFFKPAVDKPAYYEFQVSAANTTFDMYIPSREELGKDADLRYRTDFDFKTVVQLNGTLNERTDKDNGWSAEGRIAWKDFSKTGGRPKVDDVWRFALCRYDYSLSEKYPALSTSAPLVANPGPSFHRHEDYAPMWFVK